MKAFIRALDVRAWRSILTGWTPPIVIDDASKTTLKPKINWATNDDKLEALHTIFNGCDAEHIKLIFSCETTKEAGDILHTTFEGSSDVKCNKLLSLTNIFENLHILEDETLFYFYTKLCDIANELFVLGQKISETTFVRKIVRSLPDKFSSKVMAIEEAKDLDSMKVEDLMGSFHAFEMNLKQRKKKKSIAFKLMQEKSGEEDSDAEDNDDELALLTKNFKKFL